MKSAIKVVAINREPLNFPQEVEENFKYLESQYSFKLIERLPTFVHYQSNNCFVNVYHGRISYEIGLEIGRISNIGGQNDCSYSLWELLNLYNPIEAKEYRQDSARTVEAVKNSVIKLSQLFEPFAKIIFKDKNDVFSKLQLQRKINREQYAKEVYSFQTRPKAEAAFHEKQFAKVIELYESMKDSLTPLELKKLEYAKKHYKDHS